MQTEALDGLGLTIALRAGYAQLSRNSELLDELNVYPVPDGDTGINMVATLRPLDEALEGATLDLHGVLDLLDGMAGHSRGNSGFILARFFSGFSRSARRVRAIDVGALASALEAGSYLARTSLLDPVEGTMLTALSAMSEALVGFEGSVEDGLARVVEAGRLAVLTTPDLLPVLARAGVVDAGALGLLVLVDGMRRGLTGQSLVSEVAAPWRRPPDTSVSSGIERVKNRYCTELVVRTDAERSQLAHILRKAGDCVGLMAEEGLVKLHVHTGAPEELVAALEGLGTVVERKIEDMQAQIEAAALRAREEEGCAVVAVIPGPGFAAVLEDFGVSAFVDASERLPSADEILAVLETLDAHTVIVLPNDKNAVPAITVAAESSDKAVLFVPTTNIVQGMAAMYGWSSVEPVADNLRNMADSLGEAACVEVYRATRDASFGEVFIAQGQWFSTADGELAGSFASLAEAVAGALACLDLTERGSVTVFTGQRFDGEAGAVEAAVAGAAPGLTIEWEEGGQRRSTLTLSVD